MKKIIFVVTLVAILAVLVACSQTGSSTTGTSGNSTPLSTEAQLLVGTFKLEETDLAVTSDQARQLVPLWQTLQALSTSNTAATEETNAVVDQIKSTLTTKQIAKITAMKLTQSDVMSIMNQAGVSPNGARGTITPRANGDFPSGAGVPSGGGPGGGGAPGGAGGPPAGGFPGGGDPGLGGAPGGASVTPQAGRPAGLGNQLPPPLLNALIQLLQKKIG